MPFAQQRAVALRAALAAGELAAGRASTRRAARVVATLLRFADRARRRRRRPMSVLAAPEHRALAREARAEESIVLLDEPRRARCRVDRRPRAPVAVLGRLARCRTSATAARRRCTRRSVVTPLDGLRAAFGADADVVHADTDAAIAADADLVVVVVGYTKADEGEYIESTNADLFTLFPPVDDPRVGRDAPVPPLPPAPPALELAADEATMATGGDRRTSGCTTPTRG